MQKRLIGSSVAIALGILMFGGGLNPPTRAIITGPVIILGALACRSRKKRTLGFVPQKEHRIGAEYSALIIVVASVLFQRNVVDQLYYDPVPNIFIPAWILVSYVMAGRARSGTPAGAPSATQ